MPLVASLPASILVPGRWGFSASYRVHGGYQPMDGEGDGIGDAIAQGHDEGEEASGEAFEESAWTINEMSFNGTVLLPATEEEHAKRLSELMSFSSWGDSRALERAVRCFQATEQARSHVAGMCADLMWLLAVWNGGGRVERSSRWIVPPRLFQGTQEPSLPDFVARLS